MSFGGGNIMAEYQSIITINPQIHSGKATIRGMRISVYNILEMLANKMSFTDIIEDFPELNEEDILAALSYAADAQLDFENLIEQVTLTNEPIFISGNNNQTAVLISETMWEEIQERMDTMIADQRIDEIKSGKSEVYSLEEVMKKLDLENPV